jgi:hypothetical protein
VGKKANVQMAGRRKLCAPRRADAARTDHRPLQLTAAASSHLLQVFHRKLCARKTSLRATSHG